MKRREFIQITFIGTVIFLFGIKLAHWLFPSRKRVMTVKVYKDIGGIGALGYPKTYNGQLAFPGFKELSDEEFMLLTDEDYNIRKLSFIQYVDFKEHCSPYMDEIISGIGWSIPTSKHLFELEYYET